MYLSVSGAVSGISVLLGQVEDHTSACTFQAAWASFFDVSVIIWILILSIDFFNRIVKKKDFLSEYIYHLIVWPTSLIACVIPLFTGHYGKAGAWYVETNFTENSSVSLLKLSSFKVLDSQFCSSREIHSILHSPLHFLWYCGYFVHVKPFKKAFFKKSSILKKTGERLSIRRVLKDSKTQEEADKRELKNIAKHLAAYPAIFIFCWSFSVVNRVQNFISGDNPLFSIVMLSSILSPLNSGLNSVAYLASDEEIRLNFTPSRLKQTFLGSLSRDRSNSVVHEYPLPLFADIEPLHVEEERYPPKDFKHEKLNVGEDNSWDSTEEEEN